MWASPPSYLLDGACSDMSDGAEMADDEVDDTYGHHDTNRYRDQGRKIRESSSLDASNSSLYGCLYGCIHESGKNDNAMA